jgi:hypothetical protein
MIYAVGHVSGTHLNPAVSFAFALSVTCRGRGHSATRVHRCSALWWQQRFCALRWGTSRTSVRRSRRARMSAAAPTETTDHGASMNPARSIGPAFVSGDLDALWIYIAAPLAGAALYQFCAPPSRQASRAPPSRQASRAVHRPDTRSSPSRSPQLLERAVPCGRTASGPRRPRKETRGES